MFLLDTCTVIHLAQQPDLLSPTARKRLTDRSASVFCSAVTLAELACLQERRRINLPGHWRQWFRRQIDVNGWNCLPVGLEIIEEAWSLPEPIHRDPADRVLIATARLKGMTLVTTDRLVLGYPHVRSLA